jgi:hypothetical protein
MMPLHDTGPDGPTERVEIRVQMSGHDFDYLFRRRFELDALIAREIDEGEHYLQFPNPDEQVELFAFVGGTVYGFEDFASALLARSYLLTTGRQAAVLVDEEGGWAVVSDIRWY